MVILKMNDDKSLTKTIKSQIYECETGESILLFLPQSYNNYLLENYTINLHWISSNESIGDILTAQKKLESKLNYLQYDIPIPRKMTQVVGDITLWIEIVDSTGMLLKTSTTSITISEHLKVDDYLDDAQLSHLELHEIKMEQYKQSFDEILDKITDKYNRTVAVANLVNQMLNDIENKLNGGELQ